VTLQEIIQRFVDSPFQLELLVAMAQDPQRAWTERDVANTFGVPLRQALIDLQLLCSRNALDVRIGVTLHYRYAPGRDDVAAALDTLISAYRKQPVAVAAMIAEEVRRR
jgi:hypothetical protein